MIKTMKGAIALGTFAIVAAIFVLSDAVVAHGGGKDKWGGHVEKATGEYHCHTKTPAEAEVCNLQVQVHAAEAKLEAARTKYLDDVAQMKAEFEAAQSPMRQTSAECVELRNAFLLNVQSWDNSAELAGREAIDIGCW